MLTIVSFGKTMQVKARMLQFNKQIESPKSSKLGCNPKGVPALRGEERQMSACASSGLNACFAGVFPKNSSLGVLCREVSGIFRLRGFEPEEPAQP